MRADHIWFEYTWAKCSEWLEVAWHERVRYCDAPSVSPCLSSLSPILTDGSLRRSFCCQCVWEGSRERRRELSATLANHLIGCHTELTFEGYRSISPEMKKGDERERERGDEKGREIGYMQRACGGVGSPYQCICPSIRTTWPHLLYDLHSPQSSASARHPSPSLLLSISLFRQEKWEGKDRDESRKKKYSRGRAARVLRERRRQGRVRGTGTGIRAKDREWILDV